MFSMKKLRDENLCVCEAAHLPLLTFLLHLAHWLAPGDYHCDDYSMILIGKMIFYGNHGDIDEFPPPRTQA